MCVCGECECGVVFRCLEGLEMAVRTATKPDTQNHLLLVQVILTVTVCPSNASVAPSNTFNTCWPWELLHMLNGEKGYSCCHAY